MGFIDLAVAAEREGNWGAIYDKIRRELPDLSDDVGDYCDAVDFAIRVFQEERDKRATRDDFDDICPFAWAVAVAAKADGPMDLGDALESRLWAVLPESLARRASMGR